MLTGSLDSGSTRTMACRSESLRQNERSWMDSYSPIHPAASCRSWKHGRARNPCSIRTCLSSSPSATVSRCCGNASDILWRLSDCIIRHLIPGSDKLDGVDQASWLAHTRIRPCSASVGVCLSTRLSMPLVLRIVEPAVPEFFREARRMVCDERNSIRRSQEAIRAVRDFVKHRISERPARLVDFQGRQRARFCLESESQHDRSGLFHKSRSERRRALA